MSQGRQLKDGISHRQQSSIGVGFGSQPHIAVPHDFHRHARRGACAGKIGGQRVTQGMKVGPVSLGIYKFDACRRQVGLESLHGRHHTGKDSRFACGQFSDVRTHLAYKIRMQGNNGLLVILGRGCTDIDKWLLAFQMEVVSLQRGHFTASKASVDGGEIDHLPIPGNTQKALHFIIGEGTARPDLLTVGLHLLNVHERITRNALVFFHPIEK